MFRNHNYYCKVEGCWYHCRLWCVWELFTLVAFSADDDSWRTRMQLVPLANSSNGDADALAALCAFHITEAHCYDPNEELRLREIIESVAKQTNLRRRKWALAAVRAAMAVRALGTRC